jgi:hypothetical protein
MTKWYGNGWPRFRKYWFQSDAALPSISIDVVTRGEGRFVFEIMRDNGNRTVASQSLYKTPTLSIVGHALTKGV